MSASPAAPPAPPWLPPRFVEPSFLAKTKMSTVWRVRIRGTKRHEVAKILLPELAHDYFSRERFRREAVFSSMVDSPYIIKATDFVRKVELQMIVMEYVEGPTLKNMIKRGKLDLQLIQQLGIKITRALSALNEVGLVHGDATSDNFIVGRGGNLKLGDFGLAAYIEDRYLQSSCPAVEAHYGPEWRAELLSPTYFSPPGWILGTPTHIAPEHLKGLPLSYQADVFAVGVVIHEMLTGVPPYPGEKFEEVAEHYGKRPRALLSRGLSSKWLDLVKRAIDISPRERFASIEELKQALMGVMG